MTKFLVILAVLAIGKAQESNFDFSFSETIDKLHCKNTSPDLLQKYETVYQEYVQCVKTAVDFKQMNQDLRFMLRTIIMSMKFKPTMSDVETSAVRLYTGSVCPKLTTFMNCEETYSSIYKDCLTPAEIQAKKIRKETVKRLVDYFCKNDGEQVINFINGKFFECGMTKQMELRGCVRTFFSTAMVVGDNVQLTTNAICKSIDDFFNCFTTTFQQCVTSQTPGKFMESMYSYVKETGICSTVTDDFMNLKISLV